VTNFFKRDLSNLDIFIWLLSHFEGTTPGLQLIQLSTVITGFEANTLICALYVENPQNSVLGLCGSAQGEKVNIEN